MGKASLIIESKLLHTALSRISDQTRDRVREWVDKRDEMKALNVLLEDGRHDIRMMIDVTGCSECPFATNPTDVNDADPDEGYYDCTMINKGKVWGESPACTLNDWKSQIKKEISALK